ncbi:unnamed protein product [Rangifer tarandus platyrhynchus]|uniref:Uncharacterized protein n=1 Tax=Rangifer tarandus platyrhynchus TaxID=3082113 RepID=A0AC59ZSU6_RANTA
MAPLAWLGPACLAGRRGWTPAFQPCLRCLWKSPFVPVVFMCPFEPCRPGTAPPNQGPSARSSVSGACVLTAGGCLLGPCGRLCLPAGCVTVCAESPGAQAVTSWSFLVTAFREGNPSRSGPALSPVVPPASAVSSLFDSSEVPCPRLLLGQQDGRPVL